MKIKIIILVLSSWLSCFILSAQQLTVPYNGNHSIREAQEKLKKENERKRISEAGIQYKRVYQLNDKGEKQLTGYYEYNRNGDVVHTVTMTSSPLESEQVYKGLNASWCIYENNELKEIIRYSRESRKDLAHSWEKPKIGVLDTIHIENLIDNNSFWFNTKAHHIYTSNGKTKEIKVFLKDSLLNVTRYNDQNEIIFREEFSESGIFISRYEVKFDSLQRPVTAWNTDRKGKIWKSLELDYKNKLSLRFDEAGKQIKKYVWKYDDDSVVVSVFEYGPDDEKISATWVNKQGSIIKMEHFTDLTNVKENKTGYDNNGNITYSKSYNKKNKVVRHTEYIFDEIGNTISFKVIVPYGIEKQWWTVTYDEWGNQTEKTEYNDDGSVKIKLVMKHEYDNNGFVTKIYNGKEELFTETEYEFFK